MALPLLPRRLLFSLSFSLSPSLSLSSIILHCYPCRSVPRSASCSQSGNETISKVVLKDMDFPELEKWVQSHGCRSGQVLMLWKCLYGRNVWAHSHDELEGLNKDFRKMFSENASFKALTVKDFLTASDGT